MSNEKDRQESIPGKKLQRFQNPPPVLTKSSAIWNGKNNSPAYV
jgi:hypothetical protein